MAAEPSGRQPTIDTRGGRLPERRKKRRCVIFATLSVLGSTLLAYYACEAVYRYQVYRELAQLSSSQPDILTETPIDQFDADTGFRYRSNIATRVRKLDEKTGQPLPIDEGLRTNNLGLMSHANDTFEKPASEFRIALLGDSMTAALDMSRPWPDLLEELLNHNEVLKQAVGAATINVMNFAQDGIGVIQCGRIHEYQVRQFNADLVVLNFIGEDIPRRVVYRKPIRRELEEFSYHITIHTYSLPCSLENPDRFFGTVSLDFSDFEDPRKRVRLYEDIALLRRQRIRWASPYPELLASRAGDPVGLKPQLFGSSGYSRIWNENEAVQQSAEACRRIQATSQRSLFLCMPCGPESGHPLLPAGQLPPLVEQLVELVPELEVTPMNRYLPEGVDPAARARWFVPRDGHLNDLGGSIYAQAVAKKLHEFLATEPLATEPSG